MSPSNIENAIKPTSALIGGVAAIGDGKPYNTALIALDAEVIALIRVAVAEGNARLARVEQVKRFVIVPTFWEPGGDELTITMKLRRRPIAEKYSADIDRLYAEPLEAGVFEPGTGPA